MAAVRKAAVDVVEPPPATGRPTPDVAQPTPDVAQPTPDVAQPTPDVAQPTPAARPAKAAYKRRLPHYQAPGRTVFVTFNTARRWMLPATARDAVLDCCVCQHGRMIILHAAVVMPDHVHLLFTPGRDDQSNYFGLSQIMSSIKSVSAHRVNKSLARRGSVWQAESFDRVLRNHDSVRGTAEYICENPVRRGLVASASDYRWVWREWVEGIAK